MDIAVVKTTDSVLEDRSWLGSAHGTDSTQTGTLLVSAFTKATHYPAGTIKSGTALGRITASGLLGPYDNAASDGRQTLVGFLFNSEKVRDGATHLGCAVLEHGRIVVANLPTNHGLDTAGRADVAGSFRFAG